MTCETKNCKNKKVGTNSFCSSCRRKVLRKKDPIQYWAEHWIVKVRNDKRRKKVDSNITTKYLKFKFKQAKRKFPKLSLSDIKSPWYPHVDRKDNKKHYKKGNIQILPAFVNIAKMSMTQEEFDNVIEEYYLTVLNK